MDLGHRIKTRRVELGLSQQALADKIDTTKGTVSNLELGRAKASVYLGRIAQELNVSVAWLEGSTDDPNYGVVPVQNERAIASCTAYLDVAMHALLGAKKSLAMLNAQGAETLGSQVLQIKAVAQKIEDMRRSGLINETQ